MLDLNQNLSKNFLLRELLVSQTAIRKGIKEQFEPSELVVKNLTALCEKVLQPLREQLHQAHVGGHIKRMVHGTAPCMALASSVAAASNCRHRSA